MKKNLSLIERYAKMSGNIKVRLGLSLSEAVRKVRQDGIIDARKNYGKQSGLAS